MKSNEKKSQSLVVKSNIQAGVNTHTQERKPAVLSTAFRHQVSMRFHRA